MALSPMMEKYLETKKEYPDCLLFYRLGDFYELFFDDAAIASKELGLALTGKDCGLPERAPMCGVPHHAVDSYITKLCENGHKVAIAEQMEDPRFAKGLVKREVIRVVTPGTILDANALDETKNHYIAMVIFDKTSYGLSVCDVTTGDFFVGAYDDRETLPDQLERFAPSEIVINEPLLRSGTPVSDWEERLKAKVFTLNDGYFKEESNRRVLEKHFQVHSVEGIGLEPGSAEVIAAGALLQYLLDTQMTELKHIAHMRLLGKEHCMILDSSTRRNLELTETLREKEKRGTLLWVLDKTKTAMGARTLRKWVEEPLLDKEEIEKRLDAVEELKTNPFLREELREYLAPVYDLERLLGRISYKTASPRDLLAFKSSLEMVTHIKTLLTGAGSALLKTLRDNLDELTDLVTLISSSMSDEPPAVSHEGNIIRPGYNEQVDRYRDIKLNGKNYLSLIEEEEREKTGIKTLKIRYNKVFGYYLEVSNSFLSQVPDYFVRKQTLVNGERFITPKLKELEDEILSATERDNELENELFQAIRDTIAKEIERVQKTAVSLAKIDAITSLSVVAERNHYVRPVINREGRIRIREGRHPVIECMLGEERFITNDTLLNPDDHRLLLITGPNMAGKSTYMRQTALICLMAQLGSFVPAKEADICISDRIFTRVGASDDLASGRSTFMVEMTEVAHILRHATKNSLVIFDEIGRGTSTFDGMSIAWATVEYIVNTNRIGAKTLFATHYHELTQLEGAVPGIQNYCTAVQKEGDSIVFLRKVVKGAADQSYGIEVARLAGVPAPVLDRSRELVEEFVDTNIVSRAKEIAAASALSAVDQPCLSAPCESPKAEEGLTGENEKTVLKELFNLDVSRMTPLDALITLTNLQKELKNYDS